MQEWLDDDGGDPGYQMLSDTEIAAAATGYLPREDETAGSDSDDPDDPEDGTNILPRLSHVRDNIEALLLYVEHPDADKDILTKDIGDNLRCMREAIIRRQNRRTYRQSKIDTFFRSPTPSQRPPASPNMTSTPRTTPDDPLVLSPDGGSLLSPDVSLPSLGESSRHDTPTPDPTYHPLTLPSSEEEEDSD